MLLAIGSHQAPEKHAELKAILNSVTLFNPLNVTYLEPSQYDYRDNSIYYSPSYFSPRILVRNPYFYFTFPFLIFSFVLLSLFVFLIFLCRRNHQGLLKNSQAAWTYPPLSLWYVRFKELLNLPLRNAQSYSFFFKSSFEGGGRKWT